jgi:hypothetical protein
MSARRALWAELTAFGLLAVAVACGGGQAQTRGDESTGVGDHATAADAEAAPARADETANATHEGESEDEGQGAAGKAVGDADDRGVGEVDGADIQPVPVAAPAVTFSLVNTAKEDLVFSLDRGWQPVIFGYSGTPGVDAKPIVMFPMHCTASCVAAAEERCPVCVQPSTTTAKEAVAAEKREVAAPGTSIDVPWDGQVYGYEKTRGGDAGRSCQCWRQAEPPAATYTIKACGFRITKEANKRSQLQCVEAPLALPAAAPVTLRLEFPRPGRR